jgi:hypothetical protein
MDGGYRITLERIAALVEGDVIPKDEEEKFLVIGFRRALIGDLLFNVVTSEGVELDIMSDDQKDMLYLGYALGQKQENEDAFGDMNINKPDDDGVVH